MCAVWCEPGRADTCAATLATDLATACGITTIRTQAELAATGELPPWLGRDDLHRSHRSSLLRKDPDPLRPAVRRHPARPGLRLARPPTANGHALARKEGPLVNASR